MTTDSQRGHFERHHWQGSSCRECEADVSWCDNPPAEQGGVTLIAAERQRQINGEGWTPEHDAQHTGDDLAWAAARYAVPDEVIRSIVRWPWRPQDWKPRPDNRVRELVKAGALIAAEIDRLQAQALARADHGITS